jgi:hypothetical protein
MEMNFGLKENTAGNSTLLQAGFNNKKIVNNK